MCTWKEDLQPDGDVAWETACGNLHEFMADGPTENNYRYCPYCGGSLIVLASTGDPK